MTETINFREGTRADRDAILELRKLTFPDVDPEKQERDFWEWEFVNGYAGATRFFVAEAADRIVGHFAVVPQRYEARQIITGGVALDVMTHPEFRRKKVYSRLSRFAVDKLKRDFQVITAFQIRKAVLAGTLAAGWRPVLKVPVLLKPLSILQIARDFGLPIGSRANEGRRGAGATRGIEPVRDFGEIDALLETGGVRQRRSEEFLRWRYMENPHWRYEVDGFYEDHRLRAFVIYRETLLRGHRSLAIADAGGNDDALRILLEHTFEKHKHLGLAAAFMSRDHPAYRGLRRGGFIPGPHRFRMLLQVFDEKLRWLNEAPWSLSWGDTDHL